MAKHGSVIIGVLAIGLALVCAFLFTGHAEASPAAPGDFTLTQPDGQTTFVARQWGDEWNHGVETIDGYSILQMADGWWAYAEPQTDGLMGLALLNGNPRLVGIDPPYGLPLHLRSTIFNENPHSLAKMMIEGTLSPEYQNIGTQAVLVILVDFSDISGNYTAANFANSWFGATGSVKHYYNEVSYSNLTLTQAKETHGTADDGVVGWYTLTRPHPASDGSLTYSEMQNLAYDAINAADANVDYASYDTNSDGYIQQKELHIFIIAAGYESSILNYSNPAVWGHNYWIDDYTTGCSGTAPFDGKYVGCAWNGSSHTRDGGYSMIGERHGNSTTYHQATIGIMAHEFGHDLSNPDLYDTVPGGLSTDSEGVGQWSVMGSGNWNPASTQDGTSPAHLDAFLKSYQGWLTPTNVSGTLNNQTIRESENFADAFRLRPNANNVDWEFYHQSGTGEYFLVENRQYTGYDTGLPGCGLLIWHIDESVSYMNDANGNESHALVWLEQADGLNELAGVGDRGDTGDPWPGSGTGAPKYYFNNGTTPNSNLYINGASGVSVHILSTGCAANMQADLTYSSMAPADFTKISPANTATGQPISLTLDWADTTGVTSYDFCIDSNINNTCDGNLWFNRAVSDVTQSLSGGTTYEWQVRANGSGLMTYANSGIWWTFTTAGTSGDAYEDDDFYTLASPIADGENQIHSIDPVGDFDWVTFTLGVDSGITLETGGSNPTTDDTYMELYTSPGLTFITNNNDIVPVSNLYSRISFDCVSTPLPAGIYYAVVQQSGNNNTIAGYTLSFSVTPCQFFIYLPLTLKSY